MKFRSVFSYALLVSLAAGCGGGGAGDGASSDTQLVVARVKDAVGLDPSHEVDGLSHTITAEVFQNLVRFKAGTFDVLPDIATSWKTSPDGKTWTFRLPAGKTFTDGTPLDARAVKFNFDRWAHTKDPYRGNYTYNYYASQFGGFDDKSVIARVDAPDPTTVVFTLRTPLGPFLRNLAMSAFGIGSPAAIEKDAAAFGLQPVASGPYEVAEWVKDDHITLKANPAWSRPKDTYQTVIVRDIPDQSTSVLETKGGNVDILVDPRPDDAKDLAAQPGIDLYKQPSNNLMYLALNMDRPPFDKLDVRRAIAYAIDKGAIAKNFYALGAVVADTWTPPGMLGSDPAVKAYPHDPAKARALLTRAGFAHGFTTDLYYPTSPRPYMPEPQRVAEALQADLRAVGITATLQPREFGVWLDEARKGEQTMSLIGWTGDNGDPDNFMYDLLDQDSAVKGQAQNYSFWRDPNFHALMLAGQQSVDEKKRAQIYAKANAMIVDQAPAIALVHSVVSFAAKHSIKGIIARPDSNLNYELMSPRGGP